ncbi:MAG: Phosphoglycerate kinase [Candidatus Nomurabacteria bacterium GW2011_GWB1_43_20]|nr:MAG: Phosphoglycerate kinase [Candidatus Nomurabacteria bacterium GW2011_GWB1_43_20]
MKEIAIPTIKDIKNLKGKRVVLRLDFNVPTQNGKIVETMRIDRALPTVEYLIKKKARVIILSHIGKDASSSLKPVVQYLNTLPATTYRSKKTGGDGGRRKMKVGFVPDFRTEQARMVVDSLPEGGVVVFENLRLDNRELENDPEFAKYLASFGDVYVNDAFAVSHRAHASVVGITKYLPSYIGLLISDEIKNLSLALNPKHPFLFILGGAKFDTKMPLKIAIKNIDNVSSTEIIVDVGPETIKNLAHILKKTKLVVWNGPLGYYEGGFDKGTITLLNEIAEIKATSIIGGGDTAVVVEKLGLGNKLSFVSTGGGATLDYLSDGKLVGIDAVIKCKKR